jgi:hypothetical protein
MEGWENMFEFGFTLTGHDELEPYASTNLNRIETMKKLHDLGFKTFASIEPVIDTDSSLEMVYKTTEFCDLYLIGLESGKKYDKNDLRHFVYSVGCNCEYGGEETTTLYDNHKPKIYFKDSLLKQAGINRENLPENCITRDYSLFQEITPELIK